MSVTPTVPSPPMTIAVLGMGIMGAPMASRLVRAGHDVVVYSRTKAKAEPVLAAGARWAASAREAGRHRQLVISIVTDGPDVEQVLLGDDGAAADATPGTLFADMSTIAPEAARRIGAALMARGHRFIDAPVTGGDIGAQQGALSILVGGEAADVQTAQPAFEVLGRRITHAGPVGAGATLKACNQIMGAVNLLGVCEALALADRSGLDLAQTVQALSLGAAGSWALQNLGPKIVAGDFAPGFMIDLLQKDLRIVKGAAHACGLPVPGVELAQRFFSDNQAHGEGRLGTHAMWHAWERLPRGS
ncbi:MAG: NAD(P)-dependent oxidoreductase [Deltaproteobacteria bacterium]|nr:NAD(P)-dependent oxidoreductase [Deltaproteobacteria bacterium]